MPNNFWTKIEILAIVKGGGASVNQTEIISDKCVYLKFLRGFSRPPPSNFSLTPPYVKLTSTFSNILQFQKKKIISNQFGFRIDILKGFHPWLHQL